MAKFSEEEFDCETDRQFNAWRANYAENSASKSPHAQRVEFNFDQRLLLLHLSNGRRLVLPLEDLQGMGNATPEQLRNYKIGEDGYGVEWPSLNVAYSVIGLLAGRRDSEPWMAELEQ